MPLEKLHEVPRIVSQTIAIQTALFEKIKSGERKAILLPGIPTYRKVHAKDLVTLQNSNGEKMVVEITARKKYPGTESLIKAEKIRGTISRTLNPQELKKQGFLVFEFEKIS